MDNRRSLGPGVLLSCAAGPALFGTAFLAIEQLPVSPLWNAVFRVLPAGLLLILFRPVALPRKWWPRMIMLGVLNFSAFFGCQAAAAHRLPGGVVSTIAAAQCMVVPLVLLALGQKLGTRNFTAPLCGLIGVGLLVLRGVGYLDTVGLVAAAALALFSSIGMVLTRRWGVPDGMRPLNAVAWQMLIGGLVLVPLAAGSAGGPPSLTIVQLAATAWLAIPATALAFALFFGGLYRGVESTTASRLMLLAPVVAVALGWVFAGQNLAVGQLVGVLLVLSAQFGGLGYGRTTPPHQVPAETEPVAEPASK